MAPLGQPKRKNPVLRTRVPTLPPAARGRTALGLTAAAALGRFELQVCQACEAVQYPPRDACVSCLSDDLVWRPQDGAGALLTETIVHHSLENYFRERGTWRIGTVELESGPSVVAFVHRACDRAPARVRVTAGLDRSGHAVLVARPEKGKTVMNDDPNLRELTCDPRYRKVLVTDGKTAVGQATVRAVVGAGAEIVWVGHAEPWKKAEGFDELPEIPQVTLVPLDVTNADSVRDAAGLVGAKVDILINTAEHHRAFSIEERYGTETARAEMDVNYFGLMRLAQEFGPAMRARGADGQSSAVAWVNLLSAYALSNFPSQGTFSASKAAAYSLSQCLRAEMLPAGIRVINVFPGPVDNEWNQLIRPPKVAPAALARTIVAALVEGIEDVYPGDVAQDLLARWREDPKVLERELAR